MPSHAATIFNELCDNWLFFFFPQIFGGFRYLQQNDEFRHSCLASADGTTTVLKLKQALLHGHVTFSVRAMVAQKAQWISSLCRNQLMDFSATFTSLSDSFMTVNVGAFKLNSIILACSY